MCEFVVQVYEDIDLLMSNCFMSVVVIYGGKVYEGQIDQFKVGVQIVVGMFGCLIDFVGQCLFDLLNVIEVVLDEVDKMFDFGFFVDIEKIFQKVLVVCYMQLFLVIMFGLIVVFVCCFMMNLIYICVNDFDEGFMQVNIKYLVYWVYLMDKDEVIVCILQVEGCGKMVIFICMKCVVQ